MTKETALATARDYVKLHDKREARVHVAEMTNMRNYLKDALDTGRGGQYAETRTRMKQEYDMLIEAFNEVIEQTYKSIQS